MAANIQQHHESTPLGMSRNVQKKKFTPSKTLILLMAEILHQLVCSSSQYLQGYIHPRWCRISSINSIKPNNGGLEDKISFSKGTFSKVYVSSQGSSSKKTSFYSLQSDVENPVKGDIDNKPIVKKKASKRWAFLKNTYAPVN